MFWESVVLIILIIFSAFFSGSEIAFFSLSDIKVKKLVRQKKKGARILKKLKDDPHKLLITILIGNNLVNIAAASFATIVFTEVFGSLGLGLATGIMTFLILVFGEIVPKSFCFQNAEKIALTFSMPLYIISIVLYPVVVFVEKFSFFTMKLFGFRKRKQRITEEDIKAALSMGVETGIIEKDEEEMIHNIFEFGDTKVSDVMTPRKKIIAIRHDSRLIDALPKIIESKYSRIPVYRNNLDDIVGMIHVKDVLKYLKKKKHDVTVDVIMTPVLFVKDNKNLDLLLDDFRETGIHMAIVKDKKGKVKGLVTLEDLLEEIVGEIYDESDIRRTRIRPIDDRTVIFDANVSIENVNRLIGAKIKSNAKTIGEWIKKLTGKKRLRRGDQVKLKSFKLVVKEVNRNGEARWIKVIKTRGKIKI